MKNRIDTNTEASYPANTEHVKPLGRTYFHNGRLFCALSGTGAEFSFTGTHCSVTISGDDNSENPMFSDSRARIAVIVNGTRVVDDMINEKTKQYEVWKSETAEEVTVSIVKLSEAPMSTISIDKITVTGTEIKPTALKELFLEFVGDSITCGYGVDDPVAEHHFVTATEDVTKAYAYKTAQALSADYSMISFSGYGIISGYTENDIKLTNQLVPPHYDKLGYSWSTNSDFTPSDILWSFADRHPDVIVINLGTNDDSYTKEVAERQTEYAAEYTKFLKTIRAKNPDALLLCTLGIMGDRLFPYVQLAVKNYTDETGDTRIHTMRFEPQDAEDGYSADWHPSIVTHDKAAARLTEKIKELL